MYGGPICSCCGETCVMFLVIDHIFENGAEHRRQMRNEGYICLYKWLKDHDYPPGHRVLCCNCNSGSYHNGGVCPHHGVNVLPEIRTPVRMITPIPKPPKIIKIPKTTSEARKSDKLKVREFLVSEVTHPLSLYGILDLGKDRGFMSWSKDRVRDEVLKLLQDGEMKVVIHAAGSRAGEYISTKDPDGYDF